ncbi:MAG: porphobilinogen synthase [Rickettsiales bacterium]|nr:porphobilinogen synthase [Rickettsiales bacterium]
MSNQKYNRRQGQFPEVRMRRNRQHAWTRALVAESHLTVHDLVWPVFVQEGEKTRTPVESMPGVVRSTIDELIPQIREARELGIPAIALFAVVPQELKTDDAAESYNPENLMCRAIRAIKAEVPNIGIIADVALDPYTSHGQDGLVMEDKVDNDSTLEILAKQAVVQAQAGADIIAPSDMMDGRVGTLRAALDAAGFEQVSIMSYGAKYASSCYGPFRDAVGSTENLGKANKRDYQMDPANGDEALKEVSLDISEGADMIMVKPGLPYLDVVRRVHESFSVPLFTYQVSGEYAMVKAAGEKGWINEQAVMMEQLMAFKRAGATGIFTYAAVEIARTLMQHSLGHCRIWE